MQSFGAPETVLLQQAVDAFRKHARNPDIRPISASFAPGRVNLMGEHADYNHGFALPLNLELGTLVLGVKRPDGGSSRVFSSYSNDFLEFTLNDTTLAKSSGWQASVAEVVRKFFDVAKISSDFAFDAVVVSNIPIASGLGSSTSLEIGIFTFLEALSAHSVDKNLKAVACQEAEQTAGIPCGISDQLAACFGKKGSLMLIDCKSHEVSYIPAPNTSYALLLSDTEVARELCATAYPSRVAECQECLAGIRAGGGGAESLRDATLAAAEEAHRAGRVGESALKRARHAMSESDRALRLGELLRAGDYPAAGRLLHESHCSRRDDMEVSITSDALHSHPLYVCALAPSSYSVSFP
jgi:galactokinase